MFTQINTSCTFTRNMHIQWGNIKKWLYIDYKKIDATNDVDVAGLACNQVLTTVLLI